MKFEIDKDMLIKDFSEMLDVNIHGHINSRYKNQRKPIVSRVGEKCAKKLAEALYAYLTAFEIKERENV